MKTIMKRPVSAKIYLLAAFAALLALNISCRKEIDLVPVTSGPTQDLIAPSDFNWKTSKEVSVKIVGMREVNPLITNTLYVNSVSGSTIYKSLLAMSLDYTFRVTVPATEATLVLVYGSKTKTFDIASGEITFDYFVE
jgi:hypothetical protein